MGGYMKDNVTARRLLQVGEQFRLEGPFFSYEEISSGNVNHTYKVNYIRDDGTGMAVIKPYLMQRLNMYAFHNPVEVMENIEKVTEHIRVKHPDAVNLHFHHTNDKKTYYIAEDGFWRVYTYVPAVTFDNCDDLTIVRNAGRAFGNFQMSLIDFDASKLNYTIPDFHNTRKRYEKLITDASSDPCGRLDEVREEYDWLLSVMKQACTLTDMLNAGKLQLRVAHNDTKINNVLFDEKTREALVVIDLDTVMPGLVGHDFGDAVRFAANFTEEDSEDTSRTGLNLNVFWAFAQGYLEKTAGILTKEEIDTLALSCFVLTCELATRFLDDYLIGDKYFKVKKPKHNVIRTRCQIALAKDMLEKLGAMNAIVQESATRYRNAEDRAD